MVNLSSSFFCGTWSPQFSFLLGSILMVCARRLFILAFQIYCHFVACSILFDLKKILPVAVVISPLSLLILYIFALSSFRSQTSKGFSILLVLTPSFWIYEFFLLFSFCFLCHLFQLLSLLISLCSFICCC